MSFGFNVGFVGTASPQHPERVRIAVATQFTCGPVLAPINRLDICFWWLFVSFSQREYISRISISSSKLCLTDFITTIRLKS